MFYLDDDYNIVDPGESTRTIFGEYDENGRLVMETFDFTKI